MIEQLSTHAWSDLLTYLGESPDEAGGNCSSLWGQTLVSTIWEARSVMWTRVLASTILEYSV